MDVVAWIVIFLSGLYIGRAGVRGEFPYEWKCEHKGCGFKIRTSLQGTRDFLANNHSQIHK
jgi:hypothetical protein